MPRSAWVAFLRAINVGGHATVRMADLARAFERAGCRGVRTHIQSGNVLVERPAAPTAALRRALDRELLALLGGPAAVVLRATGELRRAVGAAPFAADDPGPEEKRYVAFLAAPLARAPRAGLRSERDGLEVVGATRTEVFVVSRRVRGRFGFPNNFLEDALGAPATTRNWNTVRKVLALAEGGA